MAEKIKVGIATPVHNRREITLLCLRSIARLNSEYLEVFTVILDDGSTDGTAEAIARDFPEVEVIRGDGTLWFTEGTNVAARAALKRDPDYILMINDDQVFDPDCLRYMVETAEANRRSVVGPLLLLWDTPHQLFQTAAIWSTICGGWRHWYSQTVWTVPNRPFEVEIIVGNCVLVPAEAISEEGLMDAARYPNFGDAEYTPRLRKRGWRLLVDPRARVFCQPNTMPAGTRVMSFREKVQSLILDTRKPQNLRRRFRGLWDGAPNKVSGAAAFAIFLFRVLLGKNAEGDWALNQPEIPLSERFKDKVVSPTVSREPKL